MLVVTNSGQTIVTSLNITVDHSFRANSASDDFLSCFCRTICYNLSADGPVTFINIKNGLLICSATLVSRSRATTNTSWTKEAFINLNYANELLFFGALMNCNQLTKEDEISVCRVPIKQQKLRVETFWLRQYRCRSNRPLLTGCIRLTSCFQP